MRPGWFKQVFLKIAGVVTIQIKTDGFAIPKPIDNHSKNANWKWSSKLFLTTYDGLNAALTHVQMEWFWLAAVWQKSRDACPKATRKTIKGVSLQLQQRSVCENMSSMSRKNSRSAEQKQLLQRERTADWSLERGIHVCCSHASSFSLIHCILWPDHTHSYMGPAVCVCVCFGQRHTDLICHVSYWCMSSCDLKHTARSGLQTLNLSYGSISQPLIDTRQSPQVKIFGKHMISQRTHPLRMA